MRSRFVLCSALSGLVLLLVGQSAFADSMNASVKPDSERFKAERQADTSTTLSTDPQAGWKQIRGTVDRIKRVSVRRAGRDHLAVLLAGDRGHRMIVDLGPAEQFREIPVMSGDRLAVRGPITWIGDRKVLLAKRVHVNGATVKVRQDLAFDGQELDRRSGQREERPISGQIQRAAELRLHGVDKRHLLVRMKAADGRQMLADLGSPQDLGAVSLEPGRSITVEGPIVRVSGQPLVLARHVTAEGKTVEVNRDLRSIMPAKGPGGPSTEKGRRDSAGDPTGDQKVVRGELFKTDTDGFYVVRDQTGKDEYLLVSPEIRQQGFQVGDHVTAQIKPDGTVVSMNKE